MTTLSARALAVVENVLDDLSQTLRTEREGMAVGNSETRIGRDDWVLQLFPFRRFGVIGPSQIGTVCRPGSPISL